MPPELSPAVRPPVFRRIAWSALAGVALACGAGVQGGSEPEIVPADATKTGPFGADRFTVDIDVGPRDGGAPSRISTLVVSATNRADDRDAAWAFLLPESDKAKEDYAFTATHLASWGFVVVVPQIASIGTRRTDAQYVADLRLLVDAVLGGAVEAGVAVDASAVAVAGHGRGGALALLFAAQDERVDAAFGLSPVDGDGTDDDRFSVLPGQAGSLTKPMGVFGTGRGDDAEGRNDACAPEGEDYRTFYAAFTGDARLVEVPDGGHADLLEACIDGASDLLCAACRKGDDPIVTINAGRASMAAFFGEHVRQDPRMIAFWDAPFLGEIAPTSRVQSKAAGERPTVDTSVPDTGL